jgi:hypothetical protein
MYYCTWRENQPRFTFELWEQPVNINRCNKIHFIFEKKKKI